MNIEELFAGIGVVIDDKVFSNNEAGSDHIIQIVNLLENTYMFPLVKFSELPDMKHLEKMGSISFLLLDWEFDITPDPDIIGDAAMAVSMGDEYKKENEKRVVEIVKFVSGKFLAPIFIFSNEDTNKIKNTLKDEKLNFEKNHIFVESKANLIADGQLFTKISNWVDTVSGVYVAKLWENAFTIAKNKFFSEMASHTSHWPKALFKSAEQDTVDPGEEIAQTISQNIISRLIPFTISQAQIDKDKGVPTKEEVTGIMKGQFFLESASDATVVGNFYTHKEQGHKRKYYMNIRPTCDCIGRDSNSGFIYLLECDEMSNGQLRERLHHGHFSETIDCAIVGPIYSGKYYRVKFKELIIVEDSVWKKRKVGRILPPIITHIAERYGLYIQRQALPRLPEEILPILEPTTEETDSE